MTKQQVVQDFYSDPEQIRMRLRMFLYGDNRIDSAWETLFAYVPQSPKNILDVGCGIGSICWRMNQVWSNANVIGLDLTKEYIDIGNKLFGSPSLTLVQGTLPYAFNSKFDLIVLMDIYEHISENDRQSFNRALTEILAPDGVVFLSYPTPRFQKYLREVHPEELQPVDEDITLTTLDELAKMLNKDITLYAEKSVYHTGDYAHVVLKNHGNIQRINTGNFEKPNSWFMNLVKRKSKPTWKDIEYKKRLLRANFPDSIWRKST